MNYKLNQVSNEYICHCDIDKHSKMIKIKWK